MQMFDCVEVVNPRLGAHLEKDLHSIGVLVLSAKTFAVIYRVNDIDIVAS